MTLLAKFWPMLPDPGLLFWTTVIFLLFWFIIGRLAFRPIANALRKRESDITDALQQADKAREEMANLQAKNEELLAQAREERTQILKAAKEAKDNIITEAKTKAKDEAQKIVSRAKEEIESQKMAAMTEVKNKAGIMALDIAEKVIRQRLKGNSEQEQFVNKLVDEINLG